MLCLNVYLKYYAYNLKDFFKPNSIYGKNIPGKSVKWTKIVSKRTRKVEINWKVTLQKMYFKEFQTFNCVKGLVV